MASAPDTSDLQTFDVPDPVVPRHGSWLRSLLGPALGVAAAVAFLDATAIPHYFAVWEQNGEYEWNRQHAVEFLAERPAAATLPRVLAIEDPARRGVFHKALAETGDPQQAAAIGAFLHQSARSRAYWVEHDVPAALASLRSFGDEVAVRVLFPLHLDAEVPNGTVRVLVERSLQQDYPPRALRPAVLAITDPVQRGRWHHVLAEAGDPDQIEAIFAFVAAQHSSDGRFTAEAQSLLAFGKAGTAQLEQALHRTERSVVNLAAEALRGVNLEFLTSHCQEELGAYEQGVFAPRGLRWAMQVTSLAGRDSALPERTALTPELAQEARQVVEQASRQAFRILEMLKAMGEVPGNEAVDFCFLRGLSAFDREVAEHCAHTLQARLRPEQLIDALFRYIAKKDRFSVQEVEVYERMLAATGADGAVRVAQNLERLLQAAGEPASVFWIYKKMAFRVLRDTGTAALIPILLRFQADASSYTETSTGSAGRKEQEIHFRDEVAAAVKAIRERQ